jgi:nucleotide-binding universal stress UspA family protein
VLPGHPPRTVLEEAAKREVDLIVLGDNGRRRQLDFGGTARAVLAKADAAVLVQARNTGPVRRMLVPVDLSEASLAALDAALALAARLGASVRVLHCFEEFPVAALGAPMGYIIPSDISFAQMRTEAQRDFEQRMARVDWHGVEHTLALVSGRPLDAILEAGSAVDLIAMATHGRTGLAAALLGGVTYSVLRHSHTPVLALRQSRGRFLY